MTLQVLSSAMKKLLEENTLTYEKQLRDSPGVRHLLDRGFTQETIRHFRLGYVEDPLLGDERFKNHISIPYQTRSGIIQLRYRRVLGDGSKYNSHSGDSHRLFNVRTLESKGPVFITEGEMDAITAYQCGISAVGLPGANSWNSVLARCFRFRNVRILADGDTPGREFAEQVCKDIFGAKVINFPDGHDVGSFFLERGAQALREWVGHG